MPRPTPAPLPSNSPPPRTRRAILHIGTEKTGSTFIQELLHLNRTRLRNAGIFFPRSFGPRNHTKLVAASQDPGYLDNIKAHLLAHTALDEAALAPRLASDFAREMAARGPWHTLIVSSELIHSRLHTTSEIHRLLSFIRPFVDRIDVLLFLRRQDKLAISRFSSAIRAGHNDFHTILGDISAHAFHRLPAGRQVDDMLFYYDYAQLIDRFTFELGDEAVQAYLYDDPACPLDLVAVLSRSLDLDLRKFDKPAGPVNPALSSAAQYLIARLNQTIPAHLPSGLRNKDFIAIKNEIAAAFTGKPRTVPRDEAIKFYEMFMISNAELHRRMFPTQSQLFNEDFDQYPSAVNYDELAERLEPLVSQYASRWHQGGQLPRQSWASLMSRVARSWRGREGLLP